MILSISFGNEKDALRETCGLRLWRTEGHGCVDLIVWTSVFFCEQKKKKIFKSFRILNCLNKRNLIRLFG